MFRLAKNTLFFCALAIGVNGSATALTLDGQPLWNEGLLSRFESEIEYTQSDDIRSRSDVIREVKQRYNAEVLRIELDKKRKLYKVRVLMPNGKVRNLNISARR